MAFYSPAILLLPFLFLLHRHAHVAAEEYPRMNLTLVNNCPFTLCPAIQPNAGHDLLYAGGGFCLPTLHHISLLAPSAPWSGRVWARTHCAHTGAGFACATGDCAHSLECRGLGGAPPATLAQLSLHHGGPHADLTSYGVSLVDGYNVGMTITPHEGRGNCPVVGCRGDLLSSCPDALQLRSPAAGGAVVGCKSGCEAFGTDRLCCRNMYNSPKTCRATTYSEWFKSKCPATYTYAHDSPSLTHQCSAPKELKIIFCH